jgi:hypothetical protein
VPTRRNFCRWNAIRENTTQLGDSVGSDVHRLLTKFELSIQFARTNDVYNLLTQVERAGLVVSRLVGAMRTLRAGASSCSIAAGR